ncbi:MAG: hypothetical protein IT331_22035 [Anaerolineae bacterium]|nr:hypothetical protein [Anaerolineae bacterium]
MSQSDVERELAELRERVRRSPAASNDLSALQKAIAGVNAQWHISATLPPPAPGAPLTWRAVYFVKRVARRVMAELLNTLVQQQNTFNRQVARALTELAAQENRVADTERRVVELERRLAELERRDPK